MLATHSLLNENLTTSARVIVCDDEPDIRETVAEYLETHGFAVTQASGGAALRELVKGADFDVVVLDLRMPHVDGLALLELIRSRQPDLPVIVVTGYPSAASAKRCRELGVQHYLRKPFDPEELSRHVREALER